MSANATQGEIPNGPVEESLPEHITVESIWNEETAGGSPYFVGEFYTCECNAEISTELDHDRMRHMNGCDHQ